MKTPERKTLLAAAVVIAVVLLLTLSFRPQPVPVDIVRAEAATVIDSVRERARTRVKDRFVVSAPVAGFALRIDWDVGDRVEAGQELLRLQPAPSSVLDRRSLEAARAEVARAEAAVAATEAGLEAARATAELTEQEFLRLEPLFERGTISANQLDRARAARREAEAHLRSAEFDVEVARQGLRHARAALLQGETNGDDELEAFRVLAPVAGRVLAVLHESAGVVQPGEPLLELGDPASLEIVAEVLTADAVRLSPGLPVDLERWGGDAPLAGEVRVIEPAAFTKISALGVEEQRTRVLVDLVSPFEAWSALGDGFRVETRFILDRATDVLSVPNGALFRHGGGWAVFAVVDGRAVLRPVELGLRGDLRTVIGSGLQAGDAVIAHPDTEIADGVRVEPFRAAD
ncbi:HlyD family efflux transporter periplasmic adaptor subunit [Wenzhouxiangella sp. XN79A]|uniref:efflux RND transporter periplasmic adaptor subunit n=1 Tax=Wenzhouxiangella sp. XN79A TaxID=2724193 RepID=UPI00144A9B1C|nr:HlyD family efflux transporter periplasmic adaptor subunit [Wenzhouxiangella sp. XN79A]NKI34085.1 HlyD family efflux transporter periplasmic adaptor subunit [Wenzhouxiangella sp. XN79A]